MKLLLPIFLLLGFIGCSDGSNFQAGLAKKASSSDDDDDEDIDENEEADTPSEIAGAFLHCAAWDPETTVRASAATDKPLDVGCGLYQVKEGKPFKAKLNGTSVAWTILEDGQESKANSKLLPENNKFHYIVEVKPEQTGGSIVFKARDEKSVGHYRVKDIASIETMGAKSNDYTIWKDLAQSKQNRDLGYWPGVDCGDRCAALTPGGLTETVLASAKPETKEKIETVNSHKTQNHTGRERMEQREPGKPIERKPNISVPGVPNKPVEEKPGIEVPGTGAGETPKEEVPPIKPDLGNDTATEQPPKVEKPVIAPGNGGGNEAGGNVGGGNESGGNQGGGNQGGGNESGGNQGGGANESAGAGDAK
jgi:uncharacterized membrane protein YgcG